MSIRTTRISASFVTTLLALSLSIQAITLMAQDEHVQGLENRENRSQIDYEINAENDAPAQQEDDGGDPNDTPKPKIYGEEIDGQACVPEFIVTPPQECELKKIPQPYFQGKLYYVVYPGSKWNQALAVDKIIEAQEFYERYCIRLNFEEIKLPPDKAADYQKRFEKWALGERNNVVTKKEEQDIRNTVKAKNPTATDAKIEELVKKEINDKLCKSSVKKTGGFQKLISNFNSELIKTRKANIKPQIESEITNLNTQIKNLNTQIKKTKGSQKKALKDQKRELEEKRRLKRKELTNAKNISTVVFMDQYMGFNPRIVRVSATQKNFDQIGITYPDKDSFNILAHELRHLLGKRGKRTWEHETCPEAVGAMTKGRPWCDSFNFGNELTFGSYEEIITNSIKKKRLKMIK